MNITARRLDTAHPPCPDQQSAFAQRTIQIPEDLSRLSFTDQLSLRVGLLLLLRAQRPKRTPPPQPDDGTLAFVPGGRRITQREALTLIASDIQRYLR